MRHFSLGFEVFSLIFVRELVPKDVGNILGESDKLMWRILVASVKAANERLNFGNEAGPLGQKNDYRLYRGTEHPVVCCEAQGRRVSVGRIHYIQAVLRSIGAPSIVALNHWKL